MHRSIRLFCAAFVFTSSKAIAASSVQERADQFLKLANAGYQALYRVNAEAQWLAVTDVTDTHDTLRAKFFTNRRNHVITRTTKKSDNG